MKKLYINNDLHRKFKAISSEDGITIQVLTQKVIKEYIEKRKRNK